MLHSTSVKVTISRRLTLDQPAAYRIELQGRTDLAWTDFLKDAALAYANLPDGSPVTILTGTAADQASLHGLLNHLRDLGLPVLLVECTGEPTNPTNAAG